MFALINDGAVVQYPYSLADLRLDNPSTSFAPNDDATYELFGMFRVFNATAPVYDTATEKLQEGTPVFDNDANRWTQVWQVVALSAEELQQKLDAESAAVRDTRNALLAGCDWTQLADSTVDKQAWATYRQALRDVPQQAGFPWNVQWPTQP